jgi:Tannase and feruloyl esterase
VKYRLIFECRDRGASAFRHLHQWPLSAKFFAWVLALVLPAMAPVSAFAQPDPNAAACAAIQGVNLDNLADDVSARVFSATLVTVPAAGLAQPGLPLNWTIDSSRIKQYCEVQGYAARQNMFTLRLPLPADWNQKIFFTACEAFCGTVQSDRTNAGLVEGYASYDSNGGHSTAGGFDGVWAYQDVGLQDDFAYRGNHAVTVAVKAIAQAYYGKPVARAYMAGYSKGGQAGLIEAQRYPSDFDGIIVIAPVFQYTDTSIVKMAWSVQSNSDAGGGTIIDGAAATTIHNGALAACDGNDGLIDGLIADPFRCGFNPATLACVSGATASCLTPAQVTAAQKLYAVPTNSVGAKVYNTGYAIGSETEWGGWVYPLTTPVGPISIAKGIYYNYVRYLAFDTPPLPSFLSVDPAKFNFDTDPAKLGRPRLEYDADKTDLSTFKAHGGKILMWHGLADGGIPPGASVDYYSRVLQAMGGVTNTKDFLRLFFLPGVHHGGGGPGPDRFNSLDVIANWVEKGQDPFILILGHKAGDTIDRTYPVYPYPVVTKYNGSGDPASWQSFHGVDPSSGAKVSSF